MIDPMIKGFLVNTISFNNVLSTDFYIYYSNANLFEKVAPNFEVILYMYRELLRVMYIYTYAHYFDRLTFDNIKTIKYLFS